MVSQSYGDRGRSNVIVVVVPGCVVVVQSLNIEVNFEVQSFSKRATAPRSPKSQEQTFGGHASQSPIT